MFTPYPSKRICDTALEAFSLIDLGETVTFPDGGVGRDVSVFEGDREVHRSEAFAGIIGVLVQHQYCTDDDHRGETPHFIPIEEIEKRTDRGGARSTRIPSWKEVMDGSSPYQESTGVWYRWDITSPGCWRSDLWWRPVFSRFVAIKNSDGDLAVHDFHQGNIPEGWVDHLDIGNDVLCPEGERCGVCKGSGSVPPHSINSGGNGVSVGYSLFPCPRWEEIETLKDLEARKPGAFKRLRKINSKR